MEELYGNPGRSFHSLDRHMRDMPWEFFLQSVLVEGIIAAALICAMIFASAQGEGTAARLLEACAAGIGCRHSGVPPGGHHRLLHLHPPLLEAGDLDRARFWGIPTQFTGTVVSGAHLGRTWGIPTANLEPRRSPSHRASMPAGHALRGNVSGQSPTSEPAPP